MEIRRRAEEWAVEILATTGFHVEWISERVRVQRRLERQLYQATFRVWEPAGLAEVSLDARSGEPLGARYPLARVDAEPCGLWSGPQEALVARALSEVARAHKNADVRVVGAQRARAPRGEERVLLGVERTAPDGVLAVDLDPQNGERFGYHCLPFYRGSKRSGAISRMTAVQRARAVLELPPGARLAYTRLVARKLGRLWQLRWEVHERGWIKAALNARTGALCEFSRALRPPPSLTAEARVALAVASKQLRLAAVVRFGDAIRVGSLVPGAVSIGDASVPGWLAVVETQRGPVRATVARGRVRFRVSSRTRRRSA